MGKQTQGAVFLSHSSHNDAFVAALHTRLQTQGFTVLEDAAFPAGDVLRDSVKAFIERADHVVGIVSPQAAESGWVKRELRHAQQIAGQREGFRIVPLLLPPAGTSELRKMFELPEPKSDADVDEWPAELIAIEVGDGAGAIDALLPVLLDALQGRREAGHVAAAVRTTTLLADLRLRLRNPRFELVQDGPGAEVRRPVAEATLAYFPPGAPVPAAETDEFTLISPLGKIEEDDLRFYLERYHITPFGNFAKRAHDIEDRLPEWGQDLWQVLAPDDPSHKQVISAWQQAATTVCGQILWQV